MLSRDVIRPVVSVIIPHYRRADVIADTLNSLFEQSMANWEAIIVDDGSPADEFEFLSERFADRRFRFDRRKSESKGGSVCRNEGLEKASGKYVVFLDSDDCLDKQSLERRIDKIEANVSLDFAVFQSELFENVPGDLTLRWNVISDENPLDRFLRSDVPWHTCGPIWRKKSLINIGGFSGDLKICQDWELHIRALCCGLRCQQFPEVDSYIRIASANHESITSRARKSDVIDSQVSALAKVIEAVTVHNQCTPDRTWYLTEQVFGLARLARKRHGQDKSEEVLDMLRKYDITSANTAGWAAFLIGREEFIPQTVLRGLLKVVARRPWWKVIDRKRRTFQDTCVSERKLRTVRRRTPSSF